MGIGNTGGVIRLGPPWPPPIEMMLVSGEIADDGTALTLTFDTIGRPVVTVQVPSLPPKNFSFQPLLVRTPCLVAYIIGWDGETVHFFFNGPDSVLQLDKGQRPFLIEGEISQIPPLPNITALRPSDTDQPLLLFWNILQELAERVSSDDPYHALKASGLLRQLLVDGVASLAHQVNRTRKMTLQFVTLDYMLPSGVPREALLCRNLDPSISPTAPRKVNSLDQFLRAPCLTINDTTITVKDVIKVCANSKGGVHFGKAKDEKERMALEYDQALKICGEDPTISAVRGLGRICFTALLPLLLVQPLPNCGDNR